jgi:hypothetical protein
VTTAETTEEEPALRLRRAVRALVDEIVRTGPPATPFDAGV